MPRGDTRGLSRNAEGFTPVPPRNLYLILLLVLFLCLLFALWARIYHSPS